MRRLIHILFWTMLPLTGCFRGLFSEAPRYLATEYVVDKPRIVAIRTNPVQMIGGQPATFEALLVGPKDSVIEEWSVSTCGLDLESTTITYLWDLLCFEKESEVTHLFSSTSLPHTISIPVIPEIDCEIPKDNWKDTGEFNDSEDTAERWVEDGFNEVDCSHKLPIMIEATVDDSPVYAAGFTRWFASDTLQPYRYPVLSEIGVGLTAPETAAAGEEINLQVQLAADGRNMNFQWYIDAGYLMDSGITRAQEFVAPGEGSAVPITSSTNRLQIPEDFSGSLRVWVVIHAPGYDDFNMTWASTAVEVNR